MNEEAEDSILFEDTKCVCGNIATEVVKNNLISVGVCRSCRWMIDNDCYDPPSDSIRKLLKGKKLWTQTNQQAGDTQKNKHTKRKKQNVDLKV